MFLPLLYFKSCIHCILSKIAPRSVQIDAQHAQIQEIHI